MPKKLKKLTVYFRRAHYELTDKKRETVTGKTHEEAWKNFCNGYAVPAKKIPRLGHVIGELNAPMPLDVFEFEDGPYTCQVYHISAH